MKRNIILYPIVALLFALGLTSCDDFLTQEDPNNPSGETFVESLTDASQLVTSIYSALRNEAIYQTNYEAFRCDQAWPGSGRPTTYSQGTSYNCYTHNYNYTTTWIDDKWNGLYTGIYRANQAIEGLNSIYGELTSDTDIEDWTILMGQARFFRGLFHFYLHSAFNEGSIIIVDTIPETLDDFHRPLSSSDEVMAFFRSDLQFAYENLPIEYENRSEDLGRVTSGAAATILGTSYLYEYSATKDDAPLAAAMSLFSYVINDCGYELVQSGDDLFTEANEMNSESIFEIAYDSSTQTDMGDWDEENFTQYIAFYTCQYTTGHFLPAWLANAYQTELIDENNPRNWYQHDVVDGKEGETETKVRQMPLRASAMVALWEDVYTPWYLEDCVPAVSKNFSYAVCGFGYYKKHSNCKTLDADILRSGMNIVINRLPEVYLMYAECLIEKGDILEALRYINVIRERWGLVLLGADLGDGYTYDGKTYDQGTLLSQLQKVEKPLECSLEGHMMRWIDLRRWGMLESNLQELSESVYYAVNSGTVTAPDNTTYTMSTTYATVYNAAQMAANPGTTYYSIDFEYDTSYQNFRYDSHAYYPIPLGELEQNPNI
ncbi:MAG: RagB/SusD family nutrient uptake outer membrane protein [Rikenellaceae bacterium]